MKGLGKEKWGAFGLVLGAIVLMLLPFSLSLVLAPGPQERITVFYSYYDLFCGFQGINYAAMITGWLAALWVILAGISLWSHKPMDGPLSAVAVCAVAFSLVPIFWFNPFPYLSCAISLFLAAGAFLQMKSPRMRG